MKFINYWKKLYFFEFRRGRRVVSIFGSSQWHERMDVENVFNIRFHCVSHSNGVVERAFGCNLLLVTWAIRCELHVLHVSILVSKNVSIETSVWFIKKKTFFCKVERMKFCKIRSWPMLCHFNVGLCLFCISKIRLYFLFSLPWDQQTPIGYFYKMIFDLLVGETYLTVNGALLLLFVSISMHHQAFYKMFEHSLRQLSESNRSQNNVELLQRLINFHILVKEWVTSFGWTNPNFSVTICQMINRLNAHTPHLNDRLDSINSLFFLCWFQLVFGDNCCFQHFRSCSFGWWHSIHC